MQGGTEPLEMAFTIKMLSKKKEKEAMLVRFLGPAGEPEVRVRLLDLAELHQGGGVDYTWPKPV